MTLLRLTRVAITRAMPLLRREHKCLFWGARMGIPVVDGALFGIILGRFFKSPILVLAYGLIIALILASSTYIERSLFTLIPQIVVVIISLQFGYVVGIFGRKF